MKHIQYNTLQYSVKHICQSDYESIPDHNIYHPSYFEGLDEGSQRSKLDELKATLHTQSIDQAVAVNKLEECINTNNGQMYTIDKNGIKQSRSDYIAALQCIINVKGVGAVDISPYDRSKYRYDTHNVYDGIYGTYTKASVKAFQEQHGLTADGIAGKETVTKLLEVYKGGG